MIVIYRPEDGEEQRWVFDPRRVRASRAEMIERRADENWDVWLQSVQSGNMRARRVLLWHLMSMPHPTMRYEDTPDFYAGELEIQHSVAELTEYRDRVVKAGLPEVQTAQLLAVMDAELAEAREREAALNSAAEPEGKALSKSGANATSGRSQKSSA
jgi:hypothetical protein